MERHSTITDTTTTEITRTGRALWDANPRSYATLLHDRTAFAYAVNSELSADDRMVLDPAVTQNRTSFEEVEDSVFDLASESFTAGLEFATVAKQFRVGLLGLGSAEK